MNYVHLIAAGAVALSKAHKAFRVTGIDIAVPASWQVSQQVPLLRIHVSSEPSEHPAGLFGLHVPIHSVDLEIVTADYWFSAENEETRCSPPGIGEDLDTMIRAMSSAFCELERSEHIWSDGLSGAMALLAPVGVSDLLRAEIDGVGLYLAEAPDGTVYPITGCRFREPYAQMRPMEFKSTPSKWCDNHSFQLITESIGFGSGLDVRERFMIGSLHDPVLAARAYSELATPETSETKIEIVPTTVRSVA